ncbi:MAG: hypothetical protein FWF66_00170 [Candidatus Bathyarchaeota archaeon]|nr:hypothetical protein [Candidatus Termiticorpusculum sp.]
MVKNINKIAILALITNLCLLSVFAPVVTARDTFAPLWLTEGTYAKYEAKDLSENTISGAGNKALVGFFELSNSQFAGTNYLLSQPVDLLLRTEKCSVMWRCVSVNATMAKLKVTLDCVGEPSWPVDYSGSGHLQRESEIYVDLYTRAVYNVEGLFLGTTHLWLPANPNDGQKITIWEEDSKTITASAVIPKGHVNTALGQLTVFKLDVTSVTIKDNIQSLGSFYDLDTGLGVSTPLSIWDPIFASVGIQSGAIEISETNIHLEATPSEINWTRMLCYTIIPVAIILLVATLIFKHKKKKN